MTKTKRIFSACLACLMAALMFCTASAPATAASVSASLGYDEPENSGDYAYWNGSKMVKSKSTTTSEVRWIQASLNKCIESEGLKATKLAIDGSFGPASRAATLQFQKAAGLKQDASFGPDTIKKMKSVLNDGKVTFQKTGTKYTIYWPVATNKVAIKKITSGFGPRNTGIKGASTNHRGIDIGIAKGNAVYAAAKGVVTAVGSDSARGKYVVIYHSEQNLSTLYQHLNSYSVRKGDSVSAGQQIAKSGNTGVGSGAHLHFGVMVGKATNPNHDQPRYNMAINPLSSDITYKAR